MSQTQLPPPAPLVCTGSIARPLAQVIRETQCQSKAQSESCEQKGELEEKNKLHLCGARHVRDMLDRPGESNLCVTDLLGCCDSEEESTTNISAAVTQNNNQTDSKNTSLVKLHPAISAMCKLFNSNTIRVKRSCNRPLEGDGPDSENSEKKSDGSGKSYPKSSVFDCKKLVTGRGFGQKLSEKEWNSAREELRQAFVECLTPNSSSTESEFNPKAEVLREVLDSDSASGESISHDQARLFMERIQNLSLTKNEQLPEPSIPTDQAEILADGFVHLTRLIAEEWLGSNLNKDLEKIV